MIRDLLINLFRILFLITFQVLILNNVQIGAYLVPFLYIWGIMRLPLRTPPWLLLVTAFFIGLSVDLFSLAPGFHAFSCVLMAMARHLFVKATITHELYDADISLSVSGAGFSWFLRYAAAMIAVHHLALFVLEAFSWPGLLQAVLRTILSGAFTFALVLLSELLTGRRR
jgi:rod shape-determining protein MreD